MTQMAESSRIRLAGVVLAFCTILWTIHGAAQNQVLGELQLQGATDAEKTAGVWVDGQYLGYVKELKGRKKILLLPGEHQIIVRQAGYSDFMRRVLLQPGEKQVLAVALQKDTRVQFPTVTAEIKLAVKPDRAAVFVDGVFVGHVANSAGLARRCWLHRVSESTGTTVAASLRMPFSKGRQSSPTRRGESKPTLRPSHFSVMRLARAIKTCKR
jgi:hypothetical protein